MLAVILAVAVASVAAPLTAATASDSAPPVSTKIFGGRPASETYPWIVSLQRLDGSHFCGGALVAAHWVATAGHCVKVAATDPPIRVRVGSTRHDQGGTLSRVVRTLPHPGYVRPGVGPDLALVRLADDVDVPALPFAGTATVGQATRIMGWGLTCAEPGDPSCLPRELQELDTALEPPQRCDSTFVATREWCVDNPGGGSGACNGDSGGPMITDAGGEWRLIGSASRRLANTDGCGVAPTIYTNDIPFQSWIAENTRE